MPKKQKTSSTPRKGDPTARGRLRKKSVSGLRRSRRLTQVATREKPLRTGAKVWVALQRSAGLNVELYDSGVDASIRRYLGLPESGKLGNLLTERRVDSTELIEAFFGAVEPYVKIYSELLALFEEIGARR